MTERAAFLGAWALVALAGGLRADDWPCFLGPKRDGSSAETGWLKDWPPEGPKRLWEKEIGSGYSGIVVAEGRLVLYHRVRDRMRVEALDAVSGQPRWEYSYPTDYEDRYGYDNGPRCCPTIADGRVYTLGPKSELHALDFATGKKLWGLEIEAEHKVAPNFFGAGAAPLVEGGVIYLHAGGTEFEGDGFAFAFDARDGKLRWKTPIDGGSYASPVLATVEGARRLFIFHRGGLSSFDPVDGRELWKFPWHSRIYESVNGATPLVVGDIVFFSATYGMGSVCLRVTKDRHEVLWKDDLNQRGRILDIHWATPNHVAGHVYGFSGRHPQGAALKCVELRTGKVKWAWESYLHRGSMLYADGHFIALGEQGDLALLKLSPEGHEELRRVPGVLKYPAWTVPTLANGRLYLRDVERLVCLDLRGK